MMATNKESKVEGIKLHKVVKRDAAFKLAETWVSNMSGSMSEQNEVEFEGRPARLGLGAKSTKNMDVAIPTDPVERKLLGKLKSKNKFSAHDQERSNLADESRLGQDDDNELESRTSAFSKKRQVPVATSLKFAKKHK